MKLYELADQFRQLQEMLEDENSDIEIIKNTLEGIEYEFGEKAENIAKLIKSTDYEIEILKNEKQRIEDKIKSKETKKNWLKEYLQEQMQKIGKDKFRTTMFNIYIQNNPPSVEVVDENLIPETYFKIEKVLMKKEILEALKNGQEIQGVSLKTSKSIRIR